MVVWILGIEWRWVGFGGFKYILLVSAIFRFLVGVIKWVEKILFIEIGKVGVGTNWRGKLKFNFNMLWLECIWDIMVVMLEN